MNKLIIPFVALLLFFSLVSTSHSVIYDCGSSSVLLFSNHTGNTVGSFTINAGSSFYVYTYSTNIVPCSGVNEIQITSALSSMLLPLSSSDFNSQLFSFLAGLMSATAFSVAATRRW